MARIAGPERSNVVLVRCNFEPSTPLREVAELISTPERSFRIATDELLGSMGELIARIEHGDGPEAALRELWGYPPGAHSDGGARSWDQNGSQ